MNRTSMEIAPQVDEEIRRETNEILMETYQKITLKSQGYPPEIDAIYNHFRERWIDDMHTFITANPDFSEGVDMDFRKYSVEQIMEACGFPVPSHAQVHNVLNSLGMTYQTNKGVIVNGVVVRVW